MFISPMPTTLEDASLACQSSGLDNTTSKKELAEKAMEEVLSQLDSTDLELLWWIVEFGRSTAKQLSGKIFLSRKATLRRARAKVDLALVRTQSAPIAKGEIKPASFFFPASGLTKAIIEKAMAASSLKVQSATEMSSKKSENTIDDIGILILGLLHFGLANTVSDLMSLLGCTESVTRTRLKTSKKKAWVVDEETHPHAHRPGLKLVLWSLAPALDKDSVIKALDTVELRRIKVQFSLSLSIDWAKMGLKNYEDYLDVKAAVSSNGHRPVTDGLVPVTASNGYKAENTTVEDVAASNGHHLVDGDYSLKKQPSQMQLQKEETVVQDKRLTRQDSASDEVLERIIAKLTEQEDRLAEQAARIAYLESELEKRLSPKRSAELLAMIPPLANREAV